MRRDTNRHADGPGPGPDHSGRGRLDSAKPPAPSRSGRAWCTTARRPKRSTLFATRSPSRRPTNTTTAQASRRCRGDSQEAGGRKSHRRRPRQPHHGDGRRQHGVHACGAGDHLARRRNHPARSVLLQSRDGDRNGRLPGGARADRRSLSAPSRRHRARHHRPDARHRHDFAEQPERRGPDAKPRCARSTISAAAAGCTTLPTNRTSTSPTASARHVSPGSFPDAAAHTISMYSLSKAYGFAGWRIGYMVVSRVIWRRR